MNGAESLLTTFRQCGVEVCFANPGTSEMHFVAALDRVEGMRCILALFEGVATGAADGYARMLDRPAATLLHLGPGLANGLSNLHNALRARSAIVNVIGDHATYHRLLDSPLTSDIEGTARRFSNWVRTSPSANTLAADGAAAVAAALRPPGGVATLIAPADATWSTVTNDPPAGLSASLMRVAPAKPADSAIHAAADILKSGRNTAIVLAGVATREAPLELAGKIAAATGARLYAQTYTPRITRGAGRVPVERIPYLVDQALAVFKDVTDIILIGAKPPMAFFAYPDKPSTLYPQGTRIHELVRVDGDIPYALAALVDAIGAQHSAPARAVLDLPARPDGAITAEKIGILLAATLPADSIVVDESVTTGRTFLASTRNAHPHDWILPTGGSIGYALPVAAGAAVACPDRKVVVLESDGSGLFMPQTLWTHARESLNILTIIFANRRYQILRNEMQSVGATGIGPRAASLIDIGNPDIDWVSLAKSFGVEAFRADTMEEFSRAIDKGYAIQGPCLIEVVF